MSYQVEFSERAKKDLKKMDRFTQKMILSWIRKNLEGCENPRQHGKGLTSNHSGEWRYRVGDYRIIAEIQDRRVIILVLAVGHRSTIYD
jgi:mRNA interferase RelE/StbE